jgi:hypothetical protein
METYNKIPPMLIRNFELLELWYFELTFSDRLTLNESKFNNWKLNRFHVTGNIDATPPTPTTLGTTTTYSHGTYPYPHK